MWGLLRFLKLGSVALFDPQNPLVVVFQPILDTYSHVWDVNGLFCHSWSLSFALFHPKSSKFHGISPVLCGFVGFFEGNTTHIYRRSTSFGGISWNFPHFPTVSRFLVASRIPSEAVAAWGEPGPNGARTPGHRGAVYRRPVRANGAAKSAERPGNKGL